MRVLSKISSSIWFNWWPRANLRSWLEYRREREKVEWNWKKLKKINNEIEMNNILLLTSLDITLIHLPSEHQRIWVLTTRKLDKQSVKMKSNSKSKFKLISKSKSQRLARGTEIIVLNMLLSLYLVLSILILIENIEAIESIKDQFNWRSLNKVPNQSIRRRHSVYPNFGKWS